LQIHRLNQPGIGRDFVPYPKKNDVPGHKIAGRNFFLIPFAEDGGAGSRHLAQRFESAFGAKFLNEPQQHSQ
jgi:hypothetical protein